MRSVSRRFGGIVALDSVSFDLHDHEILGILGPNGAGKTTLFDVLSGFVTPDTGDISLRDFERSGALLDLQHCSAPTRAQRGLGRTFQTARLFPALTVTEAVAVACEDIVAVRDPVAAALGLPAVRRSEAGIDARVEELIERFGLVGQRDLFVRELSMGQRRILSLACALASVPHVLLLDEPSAGITTAEATALAQVLIDVRDELDVSMVIIEHDLALLRAVADRLLALDVGSVIAEGPPESVLAHPAVVASYLGSPS